MSRAERGAIISSGTTMLAGVVGWPVAQSLSPRLHGYWLRQLGIDGAYLPLAVAPGGFETAIRGLAAAGFRGVNVTVPFKQPAFAICDEVSLLARRAGAVNTLVFEAGCIRGDSTDGTGFLRSLADADVAVGPTLILGAGGAARAIAAALADAGAPVMITARRDMAAAALADTLGVRALEWARRERGVADVALLVNTTSGGMAGQPPLDFTLGAAARCAVADIVYAPRRTALLAAAEARGLPTVEGIGMLLHQAVPGFAAWFGVEPVVDAALRAHVLAPSGSRPAAGALR